MLDNTSAVESLHNLTTFYSATIGVIHNPVVTNYMRLALSHNKIGNE